MSNKRLSAVWEHSRQKGTRLLVLLSLADRADDDGHCWPSHEDTARRARSARSYALQLLAEIEADGEIYVHRRPGKTHRYIVLVGMSEEDIRKALSVRFGYSEAEIDEKYTKIKGCLQNRHVSSTEQVVSVKQTGGVSSTEHEPSLTQKEPTLPQNNEPTLAAHILTSYGIELPEELQTEDFSVAWLEWEEYRKEKRKKLTKTSVKKQLKLLAEYSRYAAAMLDKSMLNGWQGVFEPDQKMMATPPKKRKAAVKSGASGGVNL